MDRWALSFAVVCLPGSWTSSALDGPEPASALVAPLILQLNSEDFQQREEATAALRGMGAHALSALRTARACTEDPELEQRLDDILCGPTIHGQRVARWVKAIQEGSGGHGLLPLRALERAGVGALPHALALLATEHLSELLQGLWVVSRLGPQARCALPAVLKLLEKEWERATQLGPLHMEELERLERLSPLYLFPYSTHGGGPPAAVFYLQRGESASSDLAEIIYWRLNARSKESSSFRLIQFHYPQPGEMDSLLWGTLQFTERCRCAKIADAELSPALYLSVLGHTLECLGPDEKVRAFLEKANKLSRALQRQEEEKP